MKTLLALAFAATFVSAEAEAAATVYKIHVICAWDIQQFCKGIQKKHLREIKECLAKHEKELFPRCQDHYKDGSL